MGDRFTEAGGANIATPNTFVEQKRQKHGIQTLLWGN